MSEEYQVIARKYRPMRFADVVGQQPVVRTLMNAVKNNRTAHAYLLVGPRGVGKTTLARIFAKALNCENPVDGEPCCKCESCVSIANENNLDVIEIDAASRNSVEDMRELTDEIMHMPLKSRYKIYIIDEIHMLSNQAWNALLKTVEEPPAHVKFIFATTEVHKVLPTIISRCQRFDLMPIPAKAIAARLKFIADDQQVKIDDEALNALAKAADGGMRDAQSLLDQMIAFFAAGDKSHIITGDEVMSLFGMADRADLDEILSAILSNDCGKLVVSVHKLVSKGRNLETMFEDVLNSLRSVQMIKLLGRDAADILDETPENLEKYNKFGAITTIESLQILLEILAPSGRMLRDALNKQIFIETLFLKAMRSANALKVSDLIAQLNKLRSAGELTFVETLPAASPLKVEAEKKSPDVIEVAEIKPETEPETEPETVAVEAPEVEPEIPEAEPEIENVDINTEIAYENTGENPDMEIAAEAPAVLESSEAFEPEIVEESGIEAAAPLDMGQVFENKMPGEVDTAKKTDVLPESPLRISVIDDTSKFQEASVNTAVRDVMNSLGGKIVDIHIDR